MTKYTAKELARAMRQLGDTRHLSRVEFNNALAAQIEKNRKEKKA